MYPDLVDLDKAKRLDSYSLSPENLDQWLAGGDSTVNVVPLGYAGNPKGYPSVSNIAKELIVTASTYCKADVVKFDVPTFLQILSCVGIDIKITEIPDGASAEEVLNTVKEFLKK